MTDSPGLWAFIGVDPGVTSGIAWGTFSRFLGTNYAEGRREWDVHAASTDPEGMMFILKYTLAEFNGAGAAILVAGERFVDGRRKPGSQADFDLTRSYLDYAMRLAKDAGAATVRRSAADVKPWATDKRLERIGFPMAPKLKDAKDAGRHLLFAAVKSGKADDPLL